MKTLNLVKRHMSKPSDEVKGFIAACKLVGMTDKQIKAELEKLAPTRGGASE